MTVNHIMQIVQLLPKMIFNISDIKYYAGDSIVLDPGFEVSGNSNFMAFVTSCYCNYPWYCVFGHRVGKQESVDDIFKTPELRYENSNEIFSSSPNPSGGDFTVTFSQNLIGQTLQIFSMFGQKIFQAEIQSKEIGINIPSLRSGVYYCVISTPEGNKILNTKTQKLVILN